MATSYNLTFVAIFIFVTIFASTLILLEVGRRIGVRRRVLDPEGAVAGLGAIEGAVFGLMGLLLAFTFSGAASRFDARRQLIVEETNAIGTAYLRLDLLPTTYQPRLRDDFRSYLDARLSAYRKLPDLEAAKGEMSKATALQAQIWTQAVAACKDVTSPAVTSLLLSSLNDMIDITTTRTMAGRRTRLRSFSYAIHTAPRLFLIGGLRHVRRKNPQLASYARLRLYHGDCGVRNTTSSFPASGSCVSTT